jgi:predicted dehydrogenase
MKSKIDIVISGVGNRALPKNPEKSNWLGWLDLIRQSSHFRLAAAHDVSDESLHRLTSRGYLPPEHTYRDLSQMLDEVQSDAILVSNPAEHHAATIKQALSHRLHLLIEKPLGNDLEETKELVALINQQGVTAGVVQNWRCKDVAQILREAIQGGMLGRIGHIFFRYIRDRENPNYPNYIFAEEFPLLYAMGSHHLDLFRYILQDDYVSVSGHSFKPPWSLYQSDTGLHLFLQTRQQASISYTGTISSQNSLIPQESLVVEGEKGTLYTESQWLEPPLWFYPKGSKERVELTKDIQDRSIPDQYNKADIFLLENFYQAIAHKAEPVCAAGDALQSIATLEACRRACERSQVIFLKDIM